MKLPEKIKGRNRIRDAAIVSRWARTENTLEQLSERFNLTTRRIQQILYDNHNFVEFDKEWEKKKRIQRLKELAKTARPPDLDEISYMHEIRREIEGENAIGSKGADVKVIVVYPSNLKQDSAQIENRIETVSS